MDLIAIVSIAALCIVLIVLIVVLARSSRSGAQQGQLLSGGSDKELAESLAALRSQLDTQGALEKQQFEQLDRQIQTMRETTDKQLGDFRVEVDKLTGTLEKSRETTDKQLGDIRGVVDDKLTRTLTNQSAELRDDLEKFDKRFNGFQTQLRGFQEQVTKGVGEVRGTVETQLKDIRTDNTKQLDKMRNTVDEKLSSTLNERLSASFKQVSEQLEAVHKGLGDMQNIASSVGDLSRQLSNVKTRGILGEVQLGAILSDILTTDQYETEVATKPGSDDHVEFAVKIPTEDGDYSLLPIDSKFPADAYDHLRDAIESDDSNAVRSARRELEKRVKRMAKDIHDKYISVPDTTNFGIMFLPFEGLYAEIVNMPGLLQSLQNDYHVNVAGPSTMAAILNSLQMSYQTLALQKRADEIQHVLSAVKAEFPKYQETLRRAQKQINTAGKTVNELITTRTNQIERKLKDVTAMEDPDEAARLLGTDEPIEVEVEEEAEDGDGDGEE